MKQPRRKRTTTKGSMSKTGGFFKSRHFKTLQAVLVAAIVVTWIAYRFADRFDHNMSGFICLGDRFLPSYGVLPGLKVLRHSDGYDGQFYYYIALNPFADKERLMHLDSPAYRYQRIGYPLLAALISLGNRDWLPVALLLTNALALMASVLIISVRLGEQKLDPRYALLFALSGTVVYPLLRDLSDLTAVAFLLGGFFFYDRRRFLVSGLLLGYAILCREVTVAVLAVLLVDWLFLEKTKKAWMAPLVAALLMIIWHAFVFVHLDASSYPFRQRILPVNMSAPGKAAIAHLYEVFVIRSHLSVPLKIVLVASVAVVLLSMALAVRDFALSRSASAIALFGFSLLPLVLGSSVWVEPWAYCRMIVPSLAMLFWCFIRSGSRLYMVPLGVHAVLFFATLEWLKII